jgi:type II secretory pathway component PulF
MAQFAYKARKRNGELLQGMLEAADRSNAVLQIERMGLFPVAVDGAKGGPAMRAAAPGDAGRFLSFLPPSLRDLLQRRRKPKLRELATFTQQLANLLHSGMPLARALGSMIHLESKGIPAAVSKQLRQDVTEGRSLSEAMGKQPHIFSDLHVNMVRAGEQSGALEEVLRRLAGHYQRYAEVQSRFISAMVYPALIVCVGIVMIFFFMSFMLPRFMRIYEGFQIPLPPATQFLISVSHFFSGYWWLMLLVAAVVVMLFRRYLATEKGRRNMDTFKMNVPVFGKIIRLNLFSQFAQTLATLLVNGVPVLTALKITEKVLSNVVLREAIARTREEVTDGKTIAQPLGRSGLFPQLMIDLVKIGEDTGDVPGALQNVADTYENELTQALRIITNLIEPAVIVVMACFVGFLLYSVLSAMFKITATMSNQ